MGRKSGSSPTSAEKSRNYLVPVRRDFKMCVNATVCSMVSVLPSEPTTVSRTSRSNGRNARHSVFPDHVLDLRACGGNGLVVVG
jgi:hypothetical protein